MTEKSQVRINAEADPTYCPYCMRCSGLVRMQLVEAMLWRCSCGAEHDERDIDVEALTNGTGKDTSTTITDLEIAFRRMREVVGEVAKHVKFVSLAPSMEAIRTHHGDADRHWYDRYCTGLECRPSRAVVIGNLVHSLLAEEAQAFRLPAPRWHAQARRRFRRDLAAALGWTETVYLGGDIIHTDPL